MRSPQGLKALDSGCEVMSEPFEAQGELKLRPSDRLGRRSHTTQEGPPRKAATTKNKTGEKRDCGVRA